MTVFQKIVKYLESRKTPATAQEIAKAVKANFNTVRKELGYLANWLGNGVLQRTPSARKCRISGKVVSTYNLV